MVLCASADGGNAEEVEEAEELCACMQLLTSRDMEAWAAAAATAADAEAAATGRSKVAVEGGTAAINDALLTATESSSHDGVVKDRSAPQPGTPSLTTSSSRPLLELPPSLVLYDVVLATTLRGNHVEGLTWNRENCALVYKVVVGC